MGTDKPMERMTILFVPVHVDDRTLCVCVSIWCVGKKLTALPLRLVSAQRPACESWVLPGPGRPSDLLDLLAQCIQAGVNLHTKLRTGVGVVILVACCRALAFSLPYWEWVHYQAVARGTRRTRTPWCTRRTLGKSQ